ncbi:MAG: trypsin-like peptidase domain-containing protein [Pirellulaceae bacterium]
MICCNLLSQFPFWFAVLRCSALLHPALLPTVLLVSCVTLGRTSLAQPWAEQQQTPHPAVARISAPEQGAISYGSGTMVYAEGDYALVVTNWHVVRDATGEIGVVFPSGFHSSARVAKVDRDWDLAALIIWRPPSIEPVAIADAPPQRGEPLTIAGYGSGDYRSLRGRCTQYVAPGMNLPFEMVEVSAQARQGDSGGPILNDQGELAGVLFGAGSGTTSGSYCGRVKNFLASVAPDLGRRVDVSNIAAATSPSSAPRFGTPPFADLPLYEPPQPRSEPIHEPVASLSQPLRRPQPPSTFGSLAQPPRVAALPQKSADRSASRDDESATSHPRSPLGPAVDLERTRGERTRGELTHGELTRDDERLPDEPAWGPNATPSVAADELAPPEPHFQAGLLGDDFWRQVAGNSLLEQIKTFLAIFGVIAFAYHAVRRMRSDADES